jgi:hypothetical protein
MNADARKMLQEPMNCANPQGDIQVLEESRPGGFKRVTQGLPALAPPMIVLSLLRDIFIGKTLPEHLPRPLARSLRNL